MPRALFRWSSIIAGCVLVSIVLLRFDARQRHHEHMARAFAEDEQLVAERRKVAGPEERAWLDRHEAYTAARRREYERASRYPWRSVPVPPVTNRPGTDGRVFLPTLCQLFSNPKQGDPLPSE